MQTTDKVNTKLLFTKSRKNRMTEQLIKTNRTTV